MSAMRDSGIAEKQSQEDRPQSHYSKGSKASLSKQSEDSAKFKLDNIGNLVRLVAPTVDGIDMNILYHHTDVSF